MTDWRTIKVPPEDFEQATDYKPEKATWGDVVVAGAERLNDALDSDTRAYLDGTEGIDPDAIADAVVDALDMDDPEDHGGPDFDRLAREMAAHIDYAQLAGQVADELEGRMR